MRSMRILARSAAVVALLWVAASARAGNLPESKNAPAVGAKAPDFTLPDLTGQPVALSKLLASPVDAASGKKGAWLLLVFYRGYW
jgi:cytochrome oxidase Cu insertion factor (SCO1/SenC/PrrC family)